MRLLHAGTVDTATIALWLGHETLETTNKYIHADMALKQTRARPHHTTRTPSQGATAPPDTLLAFLESL